MKLNKIWLLLVLAVIFSLPGCFGVTKTEYVNFSSSPGLSDILAEYFSDDLIQTMRNDAIPVKAIFNGINVFSTSQYGRRFMAGTANLKDIFDARNTTNLAIFKKYAKDHLLIQNPTPTQYFARYALAAITFMGDYVYDAVLFYPDEFNPVLTGSTDTWMMLRDVPAQTGLGAYYSARVDNRHPIISGGIQMTPLNNNELWLYYIPTAGTAYQTFTYTPDTTIVHGSTNPELLNPYTPPTATEQDIARRQALGIIPSPLSNRNDVPVGSWVSDNPTYLNNYWNIGFFFSGLTDKGTWGSYGFYVLPLDTDFWPGSF